MVIILVVSVILNVFFIYKLFDSQLSIDHSSMEKKSLQRSNEASFILIQQLAKRMPPEDFEEFVEGAERNGLVIQKEGSKTLIEEYEFQIVDDKVSVNKF